MTEPTSPAPMQFYQSVHEGLQQCSAKAFSDTEAVDGVVEALDGWVSAYPDQSRDVEALSLGACYTASMFHAADAASRLGEIGLVASLIKPMPGPADRATAVLLELLTAEAELDSGRFRQAQSQLDDAGDALRDSGRVGKFAPYLSMRHAHLSGRIAEAALESAQAAPCYLDAIERAEPLLKNRALLRALGLQWARLVFATGIDLFESGDEMAVSLFRKDVLRTYRLSAIGYGRTQGGAEAARRAVDACLSFGLPIDVSPVSLRPILLELTPDSGSLFDALLESAGEIESKRMQAAWRLVITLARGRILARAGEDDAWADAYTEASSLLPSVHDAAVWAGAWADVIEEDGATEATVNAFLSAYRVIVDETNGRPFELPLRVQFDGAIASAISMALVDFDADPSDATGSRLSTLIDSLQNPDAAELSFVVEADSELDEPLSNAYRTALNRIGRLEYAMTRADSACALLMQTAGDRVRFILATGDPALPLIATEAEPGYLDAAQELSRALAHAIRDPGIDNVETLGALGRAAFDALPSQIAGVIRDCDTVYIVPDFRANSASIPFELFHDGTDFIGLRKVIARSMSLAGLLRTVEAPVITRFQGQRAVCLAAPEARGKETLKYAAEEVGQVARVLRDRGWDVPDIELQQIESSRLVDAMELARVTHIAAHGSVHAGGEALLLHGDTALTVKDIEERPRLIGGLVFLNACSLGRARYLGAGVNRGIAQALLRAGAPAVVANLLPVEDRSAMQLARVFYDRLETDDAGAALLAARKAVAAERPPSRWGTTILLGDPRFRLADTAAGLPEDGAAALLHRSSVPGEQSSGTQSASPLWPDDDGPVNTRFDGALCWAQAASELDTDSSPKELLEAARAARALDNRPGEALFLYSAGRAIEDPDERRGVLDKAIWALKPLAPLNEIWNRMHVEMLAERKKLDARGEIETIDTGRMKVNDRSDPAVRAILQIQNAVDQQQLDEHGPLPLRLPERSIEDIAWNAIVIGQQNRFRGQDSQAGFAAQMAAKLVSLDFVPEHAADDLQRVLASLLNFYWEKQRVTHLEPERAIGQSNGLSLAIRQFANGAPAEVVEFMGPIAADIEAMGRPSDDSRDEFQRALEALTSDDTPDDSPAAIERRLREGLERCKERSAETRASAAAWILGTILIRAHHVRRESPPNTRLHQQLLDLHLSMYSDFEGWFWPLLVEGYKSVRETDYDFVQRWKWNVDSKAG